jgi:predicted ribosome quality control (RQC) complex YloA/Tae2 family protein
VSSDGIDLYVGRNNYQNEELDFKIAGPEDWWFHAKNIPGSHVIAKTGSRELPDRTCLEAAALAAYYSKAGAGGAGAGSEGVKVEVDYVRRRELKKVPGAAPGFVIYHTNYSIVIEPKESI